LFGEKPVLWARTCRQNRRITAAAGKTNIRSMLTASIEPSPASLKAAVTSGFLFVRKVAARRLLEALPGADGQIQEQPKF
jgi:hypothetical protein